MKRLLSVGAVLGLFVVTTMSAVAQMPAHGSTLVAQRGVPINVMPGVSPNSLDNLEVCFSFYPSPDDDAVDQALGAEIAYSFYAAPGMALRLGLGSESWETDDSVEGLDDARVIPLGLSLLFCPPPVEGGVPIHIEAGLRYLFVDAQSENGDFDNAVAGLVGLGLSVPQYGGFSLGLFAGYQFDVSVSEDDIGEELSFGGVITRISLRAQF